MSERQIVCEDLSLAIDDLRRDGFRLDSIYPADDPRRATLSRAGESVLLTTPDAVALPEQLPSFESEEGHVHGPGCGHDHDHGAKSKKSAAKPKAKAAAKSDDKLVADKPAKGAVEKTSTKPKPAKPLKDAPAAKAPTAKAEAKPAAKKAAAKKAPAKKA